MIQYLLNNLCIFFLSIFQHFCQDTQNLKGQGNYPFPKQALVFFTCLQYKSFENTVGKGEIARYEQFLLFPQCFLSDFRAFCPFSTSLKLSYANSFRLEESKICRLGKG